jgi:hypothetical protein
LIANLKIFYRPARKKGSVSIRLVRRYDTAMAEVKLVVVEEYGSRAEADLAKCALEDAGIAAMSQADTAGGMREHLAWSGAGFKILVREQDLAVARELLAGPGETSDDSRLEIPDDAK